MISSTITWATSNIEQLLGFINTISGGNEFMAGLLSASLLAGITYLIRDIPKSIYLFCRGQVITTLTFNNAGYQGNEEIFNEFLSWYCNSYWIKFSRNLSLDTMHLQNNTGQYYKKSSKSAGFGWHLLFKSGKFFWFKKVSLDSAGAEREKHQITIYTLGRSPSAFNLLVSEFTPVFKENAEVSVSKWGDGNWGTPTPIPLRLESSVIMASQVKHKLTKAMDNFIGNRDWFLENGMAHKLSLVLHGPSGTGKTSIIKMLASRYKRPIHTINLNHMTDTTLMKAFDTVTKGSIVAIEDFEQISSLKDRAKESEDSSSLSFLTLSGILNTLDGIVPLDNVVVIFTTNHLEKVDPALYRKGRVDLLLEILPLESEDVIAYLDLKYPDEVSHREMTFSTIKGCDLQAAYIDNFEDYVKLVEILELKEL